jgi:hypothetical protein
MNIVIEHDIPMPKPDGRAKYARSKWTHIYNQMKRGDSFVVDRKEYNAARLSAAVAGIGIISRQIAPGTYRIWKKST